MDPECADVKPSAWVTSVVTTAVTSNFLEVGPKVAQEYIAKRQFPADVMNTMLKLKDQNQWTGEDTAYEFMERYPDLWKSWIPADVAAKVAKTL